MEQDECRNSEHLCRRLYYKCYHIDNEALRNILLSVCIHSVWLVHISLTFEPTGDTCELLLVGVAHSFGMVGHVQQSVRRMANCTMIEFQEVSEVSNTSPNTRICLFLEMVILCFTSHWSLVLINLAADFSG